MEGWYLLTYIQRKFYERHPELEGHQRGGYTVFPLASAISREVHNRRGRMHFGIQATHKRHIQLEIPVPHTSHQVSVSTQSCGTVFISRNHLE